MPRKTRTHFTLDDLPKGSMIPRHLTKQEFARRVWSLMNAKGWRQADLHRASGVARDSVSSYVRGEVLPTPVNLRKLADALDVTPEDILPNYPESALDEETPAFEMRVSTNAPQLAWLRVNRLIHTRTALNILDLLEKDNADAERSGGEAPVFDKQD